MVNHWSTTAGTATATGAVSTNPKAFGAAGRLTTSPVVSPPTLELSLSLQPASKIEIINVDNKNVLGVIDQYPYLKIKGYSQVLLLNFNDSYMNNRLNLFIFQKLL